MKPYWIYGKHPTLEALKNPKRYVKQILIVNNSYKELIPYIYHTKTYLVDKKTIEEKTGFTSLHQGMCAFIHPLPSYELNLLKKITDPNQIVMVLDQVTDPHNIGAILRSCAVFNVKALIVQSRHTPCESATLAKVASGSLEHVPLIYLPNLSFSLKQLQELGFWSIGLSETGSQFLDKVSLTGKIAFVLGSEGSGLRRLIQENCDYLAKIRTLSSFTTLNISNAAAISLYEASKQQLV